MGTLQQGQVNSSPLLLGSADTVTERDGSRSYPEFLVRSYVWLGLSQLCSVVLGIAFVLYAARILGVREYGALSVGMALGEMLLFLADAGLATIFLREGSQRKSELVSLLSSALSAQALMVLASEALLFVAILTLRLALVDGLALFLVGSVTLLAGPTRLLRTVFRILQSPSLDAFGLCIERLCVLGFGMIALQLGGSILGVAVGMFTGLLLSCVLHLGLVIRHLPLTYAAVDITGAIGLIQISWPIMVGAFFQGVAQRSEVLLLERLRSLAEVGLYTSGSRIVTQLFYIGAATQLVLLPLFSTLAMRNRVALEAVQCFVLRIAFLISVPIALVIHFNAGTIVHVLFPESFSDSASSLEILVWSIPFGLGHWVLASSLVALGQVRLIAVGWAIAFGVNISWNLLLIPGYGIVGAAWSRVLAEAALFGTWFAYLRSATSEKKLEWAVLLAAAGISFGLATTIVDSVGRETGAIIGSVAFVAILMSTGFISRKDAKVAIGVLRQEAPPATF